VTYNFSSLQAMVVTDAKDEGQKPVDSGETDGRTDRRTEAIALPPVLTWSVK